MAECEDCQGVTRGRQKSSRGQYRGCGRYYTGADSEAGFNNPNQDAGNQARYYSCGRGTYHGGGHQIVNPASGYVCQNQASGNYSDDIPKRMDYPRYDNGRGGYRGRRSSSISSETGVNHDASTSVFEDGHRANSSQSLNRGRNGHRRGRRDSMPSETCETSIPSEQNHGSHQFYMNHRSLSSSQLSHHAETPVDSPAGAPSIPVASSRYVNRSFVDSYITPLMQVETLFSGHANGPAFGRQDNARIPKAGYRRGHNKSCFQQRQLSCDGKSKPVNEAMSLNESSVAAPKIMKPQQRVQRISSKSSVTSVISDVDSPPAANPAPEIDQTKNAGSSQPGRRFCSRRDSSHADELRTSCSASEFESGKNQRGTPPRREQKAVKLEETVVCITFESIQLNSTSEAAEAVMNVSGFRLSEAQLRLVTDQTDMCVVEVKCPARDLAERLVKEVNKEAAVSNVHAAIKEGAISAPLSDKTSLKHALLKSTASRTKPAKNMKQRALVTETQDDDFTFVAIYLTQKVDIATAVEYIAEISGFRLNESLIELGSNSDSKFVVYVKCASRNQGRKLVSIVNKQESETHTHAELKNPEEVTTVSVWNTLRDKADKLVEKHQQKVDEVIAKISEIRDLKQRRNREIPIEEFLRRQALVKPLEGKQRELEMQTAEFANYMNTLHAKLESCITNKTVASDLKRYRMEFGLECSKFEAGLPMYARKSTIIDLIKSNRVSIILGETGSGKSTQMLQYLYDAGVSDKGLVVCTQPRKVAAISLARRVAQELGCQVGQLVGYQVGMQAKRTPNTHLLYVTDHVLLNDCLKDPLFTKYSCIVIDEAHERNIYSDLLIGFVKRALPERPDLRVVITSATINSELFVNYFANCSTYSNDEKPPVLKVSGRAFPVDEFYSSAAFEDYVTAAAEKALEVHQTEEPGDILVFLTSPIETEKACKLLQTLSNNDQRIRALELHGRLQVEDQQKVFECTPPLCRKIVFATNCAETSITIPGVKYVIDTGRVRELKYDAKRNMSELVVEWVTKSSAEQRKGRAGRTDYGKCFRLYTKDKYDAMRPESVPEILRVHLGQAMLKLMTLGISNPAEFDFVESPSTDAIQNALSVLRELKAYDDNGITDIGQKLAKLSLEPRLGKVALRGIEEGFPLEAVLMASVSTVGGSIFFRGGGEEQKQQADRKKTRFCDEWGDIITLVNVYKEWDDVPERLRNKWCVDNCINAKSMRAAREILKEIKHTFKQELNIDIHNDFCKDVQTNEKMAKILFECYPSNLSRYCGHQREGYCLANEPTSVRSVHPSSSLNFIGEWPKWVIYEQVLTTTRTYMLNVTMLEEEWVMDCIASGNVTVCLADIDSVVVKPHPGINVGSYCIGYVLGNKAQVIREIDSNVKADDLSGKCVVDVFSPDRISGGSITLYTNDIAKDLASGCLMSHLDDVKRSLRCEAVEDRLLENSSVRFVLEKGGLVRAILMPDELRQVKITHVRDGFDAEKMVAEICEKLYGEVERVKPDKRPNDVWGYVTFRSHEHAAAALMDRDRHAKDFLIESCSGELKAAKSQNSCQFTVKVVGQRRPLLGICYVSFRHMEDFTHVASSVSSIVIRRTDNEGNTLSASALAVQINRKTGNQLYLRNVPNWATADMIRLQLVEKVGREIEFENVTLPRGKPPHALMSNQMYANFTSDIQRTLLSSHVDVLDYNLDAKQPQDKDYFLNAFIRFNDLAKAELAVRNLNAKVSNGHPVEASLDFRASFQVPLYVSNMLSAKINTEIRELQQEAERVLRINSKLHHHNPNLVLFDISAASIRDLVTAKNTLGDLLTGRPVTLNSQQFAYIKSPAGKAVLDCLQTQTDTKLRFDDRQATVFVHGTGDSVGELTHQLMDHLNSRAFEPVKELSLCSGGYPRGLMRAVVVKYGWNLEALKQESAVTALDLVLRRHCIRYQGNSTACDKLKCLIDDVAGSLPQPKTGRAETVWPECPVCLTPSEQESFYTTELCGHVYCKSCVMSLVESSLRNNSIPIKCAAENCDTDFALQDFRNLYNNNLEQLYEAAIRTFMMSHSIEYKYCITPNCRMIYKCTPQDGEGREFFCSECRTSLCTSCAVVYHTGIQCRIYRLLGDKGEIPLWLAADTKKRTLCPNLKCSIPIEKNEGCNHMQCSACRVHFCWLCKEQFAESKMCYDHLSAKHGGFFDPGYVERYA